VSVRSTAIDAPARADARLAWTLVAPAVAIIALVTCFPLAWTIWESLHLHDLRMPWLGRPFIGSGNYVEAFYDTRFRAALLHTAAFAAISVGLELVLGLALALTMHGARKGRALLRVLVLLPWAIPTAVSALIWRFMFEGQTGVLNTLLVRAGVVDAPIVWLIHPLGAWVPIVTADVWKTAPFVALLLLAGLQNIDEALYDAARVDGASPRQQLFEITLPLLKPAILVAVAFRLLDAFRVFDLIYVLTGGGPGTATESISVYTFSALLQKLRFGYASALSVIIFGVTFWFGLLYVRLAGRSLIAGER
jgi:multiple sugar transport system permease protein